MKVEQGDAPDLHKRTKQFALRIIRLYRSLPKQDGVAQVLGKQLLRSATSVGAQYREARRARSAAEFVSKLQCALQEMDETAYWLELIVEAELAKPSSMTNLLGEASELTAVLASSVKTAKARK